MTIKVGDAVMTPGGMGEVLAVTDKEFGVSVLSAGYEQEQWFRAADLTRLVPDDGLSPAKPPPAAVTREEPTLRDRFAMAALSGLMSDGENPVPTKYLGSFAYAAADAMLDARLRGEEKS